MSEFVETIKEHDYYKLYFLNSKPIIIYEDHRFIVPILWLAKKHKLINSGINMFCMDGHIDGLLHQKNKDKIKNFANLSSFEDVFIFCRDQLGTMDDDWIKLLMDCDLLNDIVVAGDNRNHFDDKEYVDVNKEKHRLRTMFGFEGSFDYQGSLADLARPDLYNELWQIIGWENVPRKGFEMDSVPILFDIDCDYFIYSWRGRSYAWRKDFYEIEFNKISSYDSASGWSGREFLLKLLDRAPFITIALESVCSGGKQESKNILGELNSQLFNGVIDLNDFYN